jgi:hypothetical protein
MQMAIGISLISILAFNDDLLVLGILILSGPDSRTPEFSSYRLPFQGMGKA